MKLSSVFHAADVTGSAQRDQEPSLRPLLIAFALLAAGMLGYSQTLAFHWDEGFHILTAYLIGAGKRPYLDFFFPQTPLNAYWNAAWMAIFGARWRVVHVVAALVTLGSVVLIAQYLFALVPDRRWRLAAAFAAIFSRVQRMVFGDETSAMPLEHRPALFPVFVHLGLGLMFGLYVPPYLAAWYRQAAAMIAG